MLSDFRHLLFSPLDMEQPPEEDPAGFLEFMRFYQDGNHGQNADYERRHGKPYPWVKASFRGARWRDLARDYRDIFDYLAEFPLEPESVVFLAQKANEPAFLHVDSDGTFGMRFYLHCDNPTGLYFHPNLDPSTPIEQLPKDSSGKRDWSKLVDTSTRLEAHHAPGVKTFLINSAAAAHGVDPRTQAIGESITALVMGRLDPVRLEDLLRRSTERYGSHQLWLDGIPAKQKVSQS